MSVEKSEHPYWNRFAESILYVIFDEVADPCILYLRAVFILASYLESDSINFKIGDFGRRRAIYMFRPSQKVSLPHIAVIDYPIFRQ